MLINFKKKSILILTIHWIYYWIKILIRYFHTVPQEWPYSIFHTPLPHAFTHRNENDREQDRGTELRLTRKKGIQNGIISNNLTFQCFVCLNFNRTYYSVCPVWALFGLYMCVQSLLNSVLYCIFMPVQNERKVKKKKKDYGNEKWTISLNLLQWWTVNIEHSFNMFFYIIIDIYLPPFHLHELNIYRKRQLNAAEGHQT